MIALFGPTGVGKTAVALGARANDSGRRARNRSPCRPTRCRSTAASRSSRARPRRQSGRGSSTGWCRSCPWTPGSRRGSTPSWSHAEIDGLLAAGRRPIVVGGTGLYLRAALADLDLRPPPPPGARERWQAELAQRGAPALHDLLAQRAPWAAEEIERNDRQRIVRALELLDAGALDPPEGDNQLWTSDTRHPTLLVGLTMEREELFARLDARVDAMLAAGARDEVLRAHAAGASETARKALGFEELLTGDVEAMKRRTRNLAKRQLTWMRKLAGVHVIDATGRAEDDVAAEVERLASTLPRP